MADTNDERNTMDYEAMVEFDDRCTKHLKSVLEQQQMWKDAVAYGCEAPYDAFRGTMYCSIAQYKDDENGEWILDEDKTVIELAKYVKWAKDRGYELRKKYDDDSFNLFIETPVGTLNVYSTRKVVCKKVVTGTRVVPAQEEKVEPIEEWICEKIAFLAVDTD